MLVSKPERQIMRSSTARQNPSHIRFPLQVVISALAVLEAACIVLGSVLGGVAYSIVSGTGADLGLFASLGAIGAAVYVSLLYASGSYAFGVVMRPGVNAGRIAATCCASVCVVTAVLYLFKISSEFSRGATVVYAGLMPFLCWGARSSVCFVVGTLLNRGLISGDPVHVLGDRSELAALRPDDLLRRYGFSERGRTGLSDRSFEGNGDMGSQVAKALAAARDNRAGRLLLLLRPEQLPNLLDVETHLRASPLPVNLLPSLTLRAIEERHGTQPGASRFLLLQRAPMSSVELASKRLVDVLGACLGLVLLSPLFLAVAILVKFDSAGPVIFRQQRNGFNQRPFWIYKFRTMHVQEDGEDVPQARRGDRRVTRVGRLLRRTSIDELPQLGNVLRGHMSLVGPRPHALAHDSLFGEEISDYYRRHHVKPGMTGWAQVNGLRGETSQRGQMERRIDFDVWYVNNWSLLLDAKIILRTCFELLAHDAY